MDILLEFIMEIVMEGTVYTAINKKVPLWFLYRSFCCCCCFSDLSSSAAFDWCLHDER